MNKRLLTLVIYSCFAFSQEVPNQQIAMEQAEIGYKEAIFFPDLAAEGPKYMFAPIYVSLEVLVELSKPKPNDRETWQKMAKNNSKYIIGYLTIDYAINKIRNMYFEIDYADFEKSTSLAMKAEPQKVLYINAIDENDKISSYPRIYFSQNYRNHPNASFIEVKSYEDLLNKLKNLPQNNSFDRIEIFGHGTPGKIRIGKKDIIDEKQLAKLKKAKINIASPNSELRFISCSLAGQNMFSHEGPEMLTKFGKAMLPKGGKVFAATRNITVLKPSKSIELAAILTGMRPIVNINDIKEGFFKKDYRHASNKAIELTISSETYPPNKCLKNNLAQIMKKIK